MFIEYLSTIKLSLREVASDVIAATPSAALIVSCCQTHSVYAIDPYTGHCERIAGSGSEGQLKDGPALQAVFNHLQAVVVVDSESSAYVCDFENQAIRRLTLPSTFFLFRTTFASLSAGIKM